MSSLILHLPVYNIHCKKGKLNIYVGVLDIRNKRYRHRYECTDIFCTNYMYMYVKAARTKEIQTCMTSGRCCDVYVRVYGG